MLVLAAKNREDSLQVESSISHRSQEGSEENIGDFFCLQPREGMKEPGSMYDHKPCLRNDVSCDWACAFDWAMGGYI